MKRTILYVFLGLMALMPVACNQNIDDFDDTVNYISFDIPYQLDQYGRVTTTLVDSVVYSFAMDNSSVTSHTFKIAVNTAGLKKSKARKYEVVVDEEGTNIEEGDWEMSLGENAAIEAGALRDTFEVTIKRIGVLKSGWRSLTLRLEANENFQLGAVERTSIKLSFTDILQPPTWWSKWERYMGVFVREKYAKWQEIYYLGADPNVEQWGTNAGKPLYWDNMPYYASVPSWYPSTHMFIAVLKQYFIDNEVYPDGDTSQPRITLP